MKNSLNYPVMYSPMPIFEYGERVAYIAAKCYVIEEHRTYCPNGECKVDYYILFKYNQNKEKNLPKYIDDKCINLISTNIVFDNFKNCKDYVRIINNDFIFATFKNLSLNEMRNIYNNKELEHKKYYDLERELFEKDNNLLDFNSLKKKLKLRR